MEESKTVEDVMREQVNAPQPVDPTLTVTYTKVRLHPEDIERVLTDKLPGYIPFFTQGGANFPGCRLIHIDNFGFIKGLDADVLEYFQKAYPKYGTSDVASTVNAFFATFANYYRAHELTDNCVGLYLYYSSILDEQDTQDLQEISMENRKVINEKRAARNAAMLAAKEAKEKEMADLLALAKAVRDAGGVAERIAELVNEVNLLKQENATLRKQKRKGK